MNRLILIALAIAALTVSGACGFLDEEILVDEASYGSGGISLGEIGTSGRGYGRVGGSHSSGIARYHLGATGRFFLDLSEFDTDHTTHFSVQGSARGDEHDAAGASLSPVDHVARHAGAQRTRAVEFYAGGQKR